MSTTLNLQLSILGKYSILPSPEVITTLMSEINKATGEIFLPNMINSQQVELSANRITTISNLGFVTQDQKFNIIILNERIDINYNKVSDQETDMKVFYELAVKAMAAIMSVLGLRSNRLAANAQILSEMATSQLIEIMGKRLIKSAEFYNEKELCEWSTRVNSQMDIDISGNAEAINTITELSTVQSAPERQPAVLYHIDINTLPQNLEMRFDNKLIGQFIEKIVPILTQIISDVERLIANE